MYSAHNSNRIMYRRLVRALCTFYCVAQASSTSAEPEVPNVFEHCGNMQPQDTIDFERIWGVWYVIEIIQHKTDPRLYNGENLVSSLCPYIYLTSANEHSKTDLKLSWEEEKGNIEYQFKITSPGLWISSGAQNGSLVKLGYDQFAGTVIVRKAVKEHMWLQFCSPNTQLYSVVVARVKPMDPKEVKSIEKLMKLQNLPITQTLLTCKNSSSTAWASVWLTVAAAALCFRFSNLAYNAN